MGCPRLTHTYKYDEENRQTRFSHLSVICNTLTKKHHNTFVSKENYFPKDDFGIFLKISDGHMFGANEYRYGFNGMEKDDEVKGSGNSYDFGARIQDPRLGRFLSIDPRSSEFNHISPYCFAGNSPIVSVDVNGEGPWPNIVAFWQPAGRLSSGAVVVESSSIYFSSLTFSIKNPYNVGYMEPSQLYGRSGNVLRKTNVNEGLLMTEKTMATSFHYKYGNEDSQNPFSATNNRYDYVEVVTQEVVASTVEIKGVAHVEIKAVTTIERVYISGDGSKVEKSTSQTNIQSATYRVDENNRWVPFGVGGLYMGQTYSVGEEVAGSYSGTKSGEYETFNYNKEYENVVKTAMQHNGTSTYAEAAAPAVEAANAVDSGIEEIKTEQRNRSATPTATDY